MADDQTSVSLRNECAQFGSRSADAQASYNGSSSHAIWVLRRLDVNMFTVLGPVRATGAARHPLIDGDRK